MRNTAVFLVACATLAIGAAGAIAADAAEDGAAELTPVEYVGTFHPKKAPCAACHAKATLLHTGSKYTLKVVVDYSGRKKNGEASRVFTMEGAAGETGGVVFKNKRYTVTLKGDELIGERLEENAPVPTVLRMKPAAAPAKTDAE